MKGRRVRAMPYGLGVSINFKNGNQRYYKFVYTGPDVDLMIDAAEELKEEGAKSLYVWLNHGRSGEGHTSVKRFAAMLGEETALNEISHETSTAPSAIVSGGYAVLIEEQNRKSERGIVEQAEIPWIYGVIGLFEKKKGS